MLRGDDLVVVRGKRDHDALDALEALAIARRQASARGVLRLQPPKLHEPDRSADLVKAVVEPRLEYVVGGGMAALAIPCERGHAVGAEQPDPVRELLVIGHHQAAFTRRQVLVREKAETSDSADRPALAAAPVCPRGVRRILDDR